MITLIFVHEGKNSLLFLSSSLNPPSLPVLFISLFVFDDVSVPMSIEARGALKSLGNK